MDDFIPHGSDVTNLFLQRRRYISLYRTEFFMQAFTVGTVVLLQNSFDLFRGGNNQFVRVNGFVLFIVDNALRLVYHCFANNLGRIKI